MSLQCHALSGSYDGKPVLHPLSLAIPAGKISFLIGPNGCGKSTLLRQLAGLLPEGRQAVTLDGKPLGQWRRRELARRIAFLPQQSIMPEGLTVAQLVAKGRFPYQGLLGGASDADRQAIAQALACCGLSALADTPAQQLSGGQQQRVWLALALAQQADILLLDEPGTYLDLGYQLAMLQQLQQLNREQGITIVIAHHDLNQALQFGDYCLLLQDGRLAACGQPQQIVQSDTLQQVFRVDSEFFTPCLSPRPVFHAYRAWQERQADTGVALSSLTA